MAAALRRVWDPETGAFVLPGKATKKRPLSITETVYEPEGGGAPSTMGGIAGADIAGSIQKGEYGLSKDVQKQISDLAQGRLTKRFTPIMEDIKGWAAKRGQFHGDILPAGQEATAKQWWQEAGDVEAQIAIDAAQRAAQEKYQTRGQAMSLAATQQQYGLDEARLQEAARAGREGERITRAGITGYLEETPTLAAQELAERKRQAQAGERIAERGMGLKEEEFGLEAEIRRAGLGLAREELALKSEIERAGVDISEAELAERTRQFDTQTSTRVDEFASQMGLSRDQFLEGVRQFNQGIGLQNAQFEEAVRRFNAELGQRQGEFREQIGLQREVQVGQLRLSEAELGQRSAELARRFGLDEQRFAEANRQFNAEEERLAGEFGQRMGLDQAQFQELARQFDAGMTLQTTQQEEGVRQFNAQIEQRRGEFAQSFGLDAEKFGEATRQFDAEIAERKRQAQAGETIAGRGMAVQEAELGQRSAELARRFGLDEQRFAEANRQFDVEEERLTDQFASQMGLSREQFTEATRQFNAGMALQTTEQTEAVRQFNAQLKQRRGEFAQSFGLDAEKFGEATRQFDAEIAERKRQAQAGETIAGRGMAVQEAELGQRSAELARRFGLDEQRFAEANRQFDVEEERLTDQFASQMGLSREQFTEATRQFNAGMALQTTEQTEAVRQFNAQLKQREEEVAQNFKLDKKRFKEAVRAGKEGERIAIGGMVGELGGQATLAARAQTEAERATAERERQGRFDQLLAQAGLTGMMGTKATMAQKQLELQRLGLVGTEEGTETIAQQGLGLRELELMGEKGGRQTKTLAQKQLEQRESEFGRTLTQREQEQAEATRLAEAGLSGTLSQMIAPGVYKTGETLAAREVGLKEQGLGLKRAAQAFDQMSITADMTGVMGSIDPGKLAEFNDAFASGVKKGDAGWGQAEQYDSNLDGKITMEDFVAFAEKEGAITTLKARGLGEEARQFDAKFGVEYGEGGFREREMGLREEVERARLSLDQEAQKFGQAVTEAELTGMYQRINPNEIDAFMGAEGKKEGDEGYLGRYDFNDDGEINFKDFGEFQAAAYGEPPATLKGQAFQAQEAQRKFEQKIIESGLRGTYEGEQTIQEAQRQFGNRMEEARVFVDVSPVSYSQGDLDDAFNKREGDPGYRADFDTDRDGKVDFGDLIAIAGRTEDLGGGMLVYQPEGKVTALARELSLDENKLAEASRQFSQTLSAKNREWLTSISGYIIDESGEVLGIIDPTTGKRVDMPTFEREQYEVGKAKFIASHEEEKRQFDATMELGKQKIKGGTAESRNMAWGQVLASIFSSIGTGVGGWLGGRNNNPETSDLFGGLPRVNVGGSAEGYGQSPLSKPALIAGDTQGPPAPPAPPSGPGTIAQPALSPYGQMEAQWGPGAAAAWQDYANRAKAQGFAIDWAAFNRDPVTYARALGFTRG